MNEFECDFIKSFFFPFETTTRILILQHFSKENCFFGQHPHIALIAQGSITPSVNINLISSVSGR